MHKIVLPKVLFLALAVGSHYRNNFFNTNDLAELSNKHKSELVRLNRLKKDYKYLEDTRYGGLRGNFSTVLTWRGLVKRGSSIVNTYSLGRDKQLVNAVCDGRVILDRKDFSAHTNDAKLAKALEREAWLLNVRESQAHVKMMLEKDPTIPLKRNEVDFPKEAVFKSGKNQYFIRGMVNNFVDSNSRILQFSILNLWEGKKFNLHNIHPMIVLPSVTEPWGGGIYVLKNEDLLATKPFLLNVDLQTKKCFDEKGNNYKLYPLSDAIECFSQENENIPNRLGYKWDAVKVEYCDQEVEEDVRKDDEFSSFLRLFLRWNPVFGIDGKDVVDIRSISSGGPDIELIFSGGTMQKLELEHAWSSYVDHGHQKNGAFKGVWIFAEEKFDFDKIKKVFASEIKLNKERIPTVFLSVDKDGNREAHRINWEEETFSVIELKF